MKKWRTRIVGIGIISLILISPSVIAASCATGIETNFTMRIEPVSGAPQSSSGTVCGPFQNDLASTTTGGNAGIAVIAGSEGASSGAGAIASENFSRSVTAATANTYIEFELIKTDDTLPDFVFRQIGYDVEVEVLSAAVGVSGDSRAELSGRGIVNFFSVTDIGQMLAVGGVPTEHINGVQTPVLPGAVIQFGADSVNVEVGRTHKASFGVISVAQAFAGFNSPVSAELSLAISGALTPPPGYSILFTGNAPQIGVYPIIESPLSAIPIPAPLWLMFSGVLGLISFFRVKRTTSL